MQYPEAVWCWLAKALLDDTPPSVIPAKAGIHAALSVWKRRADSLRLICGSRLTNIAGMTRVLLVGETFYLSPSFPSVIPVQTGIHAGKKSERSEPQAPVRCRQIAEWGSGTRAKRSLRAWVWAEPPGLRSGVVCRDDARPDRQSVSESRPFICPEGK